jgi:hypothetical protein
MSEIDSTFRAYTYPGFSSSKLNWAEGSSLEDTIVSWGYSYPAIAAFGTAYPFRIEVYKKPSADEDIGGVIVKSFLVTIIMGDHLEILIVDGLSGLLLFLKEYVTVAQVGMNTFQLEKEAEQVLRRSDS